MHCTITNTLLGQFLEVELEVSGLLFAAKLQGQLLASQLVQREAQVLDIKRILSKLWNIFMRQCYR